MRDVPLRLIQATGSAGRLPAFPSNRGTAVAASGLVL